MVIEMEDAMRIPTLFNLLHGHNCTRTPGGVSRGSGQKKIVLPLGLPAGPKL